MELTIRWIQFSTIVRREVGRFMRIWTQTLLPPVITQSLYFIIFGGFVGSQVRAVGGISYMAFLVPGLVMMSVITSSYSNVSSSFFGAKFQKSIEELLVAPVSNWIVILGFVIGGVLRGLLVGLIVFGVSMFFVRPEVQHFEFVLLFIFLTATAFSLAGLANAVFAKKFDDVSIVPTFVLTPLTYLGGVFYSVKNLPDLWQIVSRFNPIVYMVDGFRYGFFGTADLNLWISAGILIAFNFALALWIGWLFKKGIGLKN